MSPTPSESPDFLAGRPDPSTDLKGGIDGKPAVIYPHGDAGWRDLARRLLPYLAKGAGCRTEAIPCLPDTEILPARATRLPEEWRARPLFVLGALHTNRLLAPFYANYLCSTDAVYPGGNGYDLRTLVNPHGGGFNLILAGGSTPMGVSRAIGRLEERLAGLEDPTRVPFLLEVELAPALARRLADWPHTPLPADIHRAPRSRGWVSYTTLMRGFSSYALHWSWTGDTRYAEAAVAYLRQLNLEMPEGYGDWHYLAERYLRSLPLMVAGNFLSEEDIDGCHRRLLQTALGTAGDWWRMRSGNPPLGHRHHGKGTYEFLLLAKYLRDQTLPNTALRRLCDQWIRECREYLDALSRAGIDDQDDETTLINLAIPYRYALGEERFDFYTTGKARAVAERAIALHDSMGAGAGQGGYGESQPGAQYLQQEATLPVAAAAFFLEDGELLTALRRMPHLHEPHRYGFLHYAPVFLQNFAVGDTLTEAPPRRLTGLKVLPAPPHAYGLNANPPEHVEFRGHMVNAPETWQLAEGIARATAPRTECFDKLVLREGFSSGDAYLLLQGYQGGYRWQGHQQAANCIVRFTQMGGLFLIQNSAPHTHYDKNGIFVGRAKGPSPMPPFATCLSHTDFALLGGASTRLSPYHGTEWTRHLFWSRSGKGYFVVMDELRILEEDTYSLTCSWRTPTYAHLEDRRWTTQQGQARFTLVSGMDLDSTCSEETGQGATRPFVLRQLRSGQFPAGRTEAFHNLFYVQAAENRQHLDGISLTDTSFLVLESGQPVAYCAVALKDGGLLHRGGSGNAATLWLTRECQVINGTTLWSGGEIFPLTLESDQPVNLMIDRRERRILLQPSHPPAPRASVMLTIGGLRWERKVEETLVVDLSPGDFGVLEPGLDNWWNSLPGRPPSPPRVDSPAIPEGPHSWVLAGKHSGGTPAPTQVRDLLIKAEPEPLDGFPLQLVDGVLPEVREFWRQWPVSERYEITLSPAQAEPFSHLDILGDSREEPTQLTFQPLPDGLAVEGRLADNSWIPLPVEHQPDRRYKRYRDMENSLECRRIPLGNHAFTALRVQMGALPPGRELVLHELELSATRLSAPGIVAQAEADLDGDGHLEIILATSRPEILTLDTKGVERWRFELPGPVTHLSVQPLDANGPPTLCAGILGGDLLLFQGDGTLRQVIPVARQFHERKDALFGWFNTINSLAVWHRDAMGRGALVAGGYAILVFLTPGGEIAGHSWGDGPWLTDILVEPKRAGAGGDLFVRSGWNHGVFIYTGNENEAPSGASLVFGGVRQPMFRELRRIIPFLNGPSLAFSMLPPEERMDSLLFAATELGMGLLDTKKGDWLWKMEGGCSLRAVQVAVAAKNEMVACTGGADGFVQLYSLPLGVRKWSVYAGAPILTVHFAPAQESWLVATTKGVLVIDRQGRRHDFLAMKQRQAKALSGTRILSVMESNSLQILEWKPPPRY